MKVVVALADPPLPEGGAPGRCAVALLRGLREHGIEVTALAARQHFAVPGDPPDDLPVEIIDIPPRHRRAWRLSRWRRPHGELAGDEFAARVVEAARRADVLHLEQADTAWCSEGVETPSVVHLHYLVRRDRRFGAPWRRQFREVLEFGLAEGAAIRRHRYLVASSPLVADALRRTAPWHDVTLAPLSLDPRYYESAPLDGAPVAGVIGTAAWPPTAAALRRLSARVWPLVRTRLPGAVLRVAGRGTDAMAGLGGTGVEVLGEVPSSAGFLRGLSLLLYPLERGSGVKVKVLEAIACGLPVVTTPAGAEGIEAGDGVVVVDTDQALADAAVTLLRDADERRRRGAASRTAFDLRYTPRPATEPLIELYERMVG